MELCDFVSFSGERQKQNETLNVQFTTKLLFLHSRSDYRYLLVVILLRSFVLLFFIFLLSVGIGDHGVGHDDGGPAKTLGVHFQLSWSGLQAGDVARQQLLSSHQHQSDYDIEGKKKVSELVHGFYSLLHVLWVPTCLLAAPACSARAGWW